VGDNRVEWCSIPTGSGVPSVISEDCGANEMCTVSSGIARCVRAPGSCVPGAGECTSSTTLRICDSTGTWVSETCPGICRATVLGGYCVPSYTMSTYTARLRYEFLTPNYSKTDWDSVVQEAPARGVLVISVRGQTLLDAVVADANGDFSIGVPNALQSGDSVFAFLARSIDAGARMAFAVAEPDVPDGVQYAGYPVSGDSSLIWGWEIDPNTTAPGSTIVVTRDLGSGALRVFDRLLSAYEKLPSYFAGTGRPLVVWLRYNTEWDCGACFLDLPADAESFPFDAQIFLPATALDESYWADGPTVHELGHWVMSSFGTSPLEGGVHCLGSPTYPGQAWSEGFATGYSGIVRSDSYYYDKQFGTFFWIDLAGRQYSSAVQVPFVRANPAQGLLQSMDENEVGAMLWELGRDSVVGSKVISAIGSSRMNRTPFARGYTRRTWEVPSGCAPKTNVVNTGQSVPMFADYLDALRCSGVPAANIDSVTDPAISYPYPSGSPLCQ
jgi:hypothetical protein